MKELKLQQIFMSGLKKQFKKLIRTNGIFYQLIFQMENMSFDRKKKFRSKKCFQIEKIFRLKKSFLD